MRLEPIPRRRRSPDPWRLANKLRPEIARQIKIHARHEVLVVGSHRDVPSVVGFDNLNLDHAFVRNPRTMHEAHRRLATVHNRSVGEDDPVLAIRCHRCCSKSHTIVTR